MVHKKTAFVTIYQDEGYKWFPISLTSYSLMCLIFYIAREQLHVRNIARFLYNEYNPTAISILHIRNIACFLYNEYDPNVLSIVFFTIYIYIYI